MRNETVCERGNKRRKKKQKLSQTHGNVLKNMVKNKSPFSTICLGHTARRERKKNYILRNKATLKWCEKIICEDYFFELKANNMPRNVFFRGVQIRAYIFGTHTLYVRWKIKYIFLSLISRASAFPPPLSFSIPESSRLEWVVIKTFTHEMKSR